MTQQSLDLTKAEALNQILPVPPQLTSQGANWSNLMLAHYHQHPGCESPESSFQQHALEIMDINSCSLHERRIGKTHLSYGLQGGETCFCPAYTKHWTTWERATSFTVIVFEPTFFERTSQEIWEKDCVEFIPKWQIFDPTIQVIVTALKSDLSAGCPVGSLYGESFGTSLAVHILSNFSIIRKKIPNWKGLSRTSQEEVLEFIEAYLETDIRLEDLAQIASISTFHFCRLFKEAMHITPHQYVIRRRIERAKQLLKQSNLRIVDIALACGFANQSHFSHHFRRIVGISPKAFRSL